jgi:hypothetical protein
MVEVATKRIGGDGMSWRKWRGDEEDVKEEMKEQNGQLAT